MKLYEPLYSVEGGPPLAFYCYICESVCRTERGMIDGHLWKKHGLKMQTGLFDDLPDEAPHSEFDQSSI